MGRADLHFHLLPGLDDGPQTIDEAVELARAAVRDGTETVVVTPHVRHDFVTDVSELPERVREVGDRLGAEGIGLSLCCGGELGHEMVARLGQAELDLIAIGPKGFRWLLVETPFEGIGNDVHAALDELRQRGFGVVLAHPERTPGLLEDHALALRYELGRGTRLQLNARSFTGEHGASAKAAGVRLVGEGLVEAIASDAHSLVRPPGLTDGMEAAIAEGVEERAARELVDSSPVRLVCRGLGRMELAAAGVAA